MTDPTFSIETVTVAKANQWLDKNVANRRPAPAVIRDYARAMARCEWVINGETIKFDQDGNLLDGQHRLAAVLQANKPVRMSICRGLERETFTTLDTGKRRGGGDIVSLRGWKYAGPIANAARCLFYYKTDHWTDGKPMRFPRVSNTQLNNLLDLTPELEAAAIEAHTADHTFDALTPGNRTLAWLLTSRLDRRFASQFFSVVAARRSAPGTNADKLRIRYAEIASEIVTTPPSIRLAWFIQAWNADRSGGSVHRFKRFVRSMPRFD